MRCISSIGEKKLQVDKPLPVSIFSHPCAYCPQSFAFTLLSVLYTRKDDQSLDPVCTSLSALRTFAMLCILSCVSCWQVPRRTRSSFCAFSAISVHEECAVVSCSTCSNQFWFTQHVECCQATVCICSTGLGHVFQCQHRKVYILWGRRWQN